VTLVPASPAPPTESAETFTIFSVVPRTYASITETAKSSAANHQPAHFVLAVSLATTMVNVFARTDVRNEFIFAQKLCLDKPAQEPIKFAKESFAKNR